MQAYVGADEGLMEGTEASRAISGRQTSHDICISMGQRCRQRVRRVRRHGLGGLSTHPSQYVGRHCVAQRAHCQTLGHDANGGRIVIGRSGVAQAIGMKSIAADMGIDLKIVVHTDSSAAMGIVQRAGVGRVRHLDVAQLWVQDHLREKKFVLKKVLGTDNPADILIKHVEAGVIAKHCQWLGMEFASGRAHSAPKLAARV